MKVNGVPVEVLKPITDAYNKGYKEGYMDACKQLSAMANKLSKSAGEWFGGEE
ncbi:MAG: hypothetical protein IKB64_02065 [Paludibacteraceae bacterium]|nr:hypothetical protein [Paludibacteraceae bacterium]